MATRRYYDNPPLIEALCQFQFTAGAEWDMAVPGLVYQRIQDEFPVRRQQKSLEVVFSDQSSEVKPQVGERIHFRRADGSALIQLAPDLLTVNVLSPYRGWENFRSMILSALANYRDAAKPSGIKSIALRYINRVRIPALSYEIRDYLQFFPTTPAALPQTFVGWGQNVSIPVTESEFLSITAGSEHSQGNESSFLLDIEALVRRVEGARSVEEHLESAHGMIETAFEECITDSTRMLFKEVSHEHASRS